MYINVHFIVIFLVAFSLMPSPNYCFSLRSYLKGIDKMLYEYLLYLPGSSLYCEGDIPRKYHNSRDFTRSISLY